MANRTLSSDGLIEWIAQGAAGDVRATVSEWLEEHPRARRDEVAALRVQAAQLPSASPGAIAATHRVLDPLEQRLDALEAQVRATTDALQAIAREAAEIREAAQRTAQQARHARQHATTATATAESAAHESP